MKTLHVVSHTHWDREWYLPYQEFRFRLVGLIDRLLDIIAASPDYRSFMLDGQTIVLDDYLEIRPEQEPLIRQYVAEGRLLVGPWYVLPDEFLEGPEALLRNLTFGYRGCRRFSDAPLPVEQIGYLPDPFGHLSQLPQIAAGSGLSALCFWRGVGDAPTEFQWVAPDSSSCLVLHLRASYGNAARLAYDSDDVASDLAAARDNLAPHATTSHLLLMHGTDHMEPRADLPALLQAAGRVMPDRVIHSTLPEYLASVRAELGPEGLAALSQIEGELRSSRFAHLLPAVLSARIWIKQWNHRCETLLTRYAEPLSALAGLVTGHVDHRAFLQKSWEWLLQNHAHDSICGCSIDQVHREMQARFAWSEQIAQQVAQVSLQKLADCIDTKAPVEEARDTASIVVFNPLPAPRTGRVIAQVPSPPSDEWTLAQLDGKHVPHRVLEHLTRELYNEVMTREAFMGWLAQIASGQGPSMGELALKRIEITIDGRTATLLVRVAKAYGAANLRIVADGDVDRAQALTTDEQIASIRVRVVEEVGTRVECLARDVPPCGYTQLAVVPSSGQVRSRTTSCADPSLVIENEYFSVQADHQDGTLTVTDKRTGLVLPGLNRFVDGGDRGDEYTFCRPEGDILIDAPSSPPAIQRLDDPLGATLKIGLLYRVPRSLKEGDRASRDPRLVLLPISSRITLTPGVPRVDVETQIDNTAMDHRLRVHFPTPIVTGCTWAESHFDVVERPLALPEDTADWAEQPAGTHPQGTFVDITDGLTGFMVANRGLPEYEALARGNGAGVTLALTLLRSIGWLSRGDLHNRRGHAGPLVPTPEAQCPGLHTVHYSLIPHTGNYLNAMAQAHHFNVPMLTASTGTHPGHLLPSMSFVEVTPAAVVLSALKPPDEGTAPFILRLYNSAPTQVEASLRFWHPLSQIDLVTLHERDTLRQVDHAGNRATLPLRPKEIATLRVQPLGTPQRSPS